MATKRSGLKQHAWTLKEMFFSFVLFFCLELRAQEIIPSTNPVENCEKKELLISTCIFERAEPTTPVEMINQDLKVCECLNKANNVLAPYSEKTELEEMKLLKQRKLKSESEAAGNLTYMQTAQFASNKTELDQKLLVFGGQETRKAFQKKMSQPNSSIAQMNKTMGVKAPVLSTKLDTFNVINEANKNWQCVTYQEYSVQREIPLDNNFFKALEKTEFNPADWNMTELKKSFDQASEAEREVIKEKMIYLTRNPVFKSIMKAKPSQYHSAEKIRQKQDRLFGIMELLKPKEGSTCYSQEGQCWREMLENGTYDRYVAQVSDFLKDNDVIDITSAEGASDYIAELEKMAGEGDVMVNSIPTDPQGYFNYLQNYNREIARSCSGANASASCYTTFRPHCDQLTRIDQRVRAGLKLNSDEVVEGLREEAALHASLDPDQNPNFKSFNDAICLQTFQNGQSESLNFFQYQTKYCTETQPTLEECSDRKALLRRYLSEYNQGGSEADRNVRSGFAKILNNADYIDVSLTQIRAANDISETPRELRERFGGLIPSISPTGVLIPPPVNSPSERRISRQELASNNSMGSDESPAPAPVPAAPARSNVRSGLSQNAVSDRVVGKTLTQTQSLPKFPKVTPSTPKAGPQTLFNDFTPEEVKPNIVSEGSRERSPASETSPLKVPPVPESEPLAVVNGSALSRSAPTVTDSEVSAPSSAGAKAATLAVPSKRRTVSQTGAGTKREEAELAIVRNVEPQDIKVPISKNAFARIKSNPNALELGSRAMEELLANPDSEIKLVLEAPENGEKLVVYATKDGSGGISFSFRPRARAPSSNPEVIRVAVKPEVYGVIVDGPDIYLNQNEALMTEIMAKPTDRPVTLQIVSSGKRALTYEVKKVDEYIYQFKRK